MKIKEVEMFTLSEAAERAGLSASTLRGQINHGILRAEKWDGRWCVTAKDLARYVAVHKGKQGKASPLHPAHKPKPRPPEGTPNAQD